MQSLLRRAAIVACMLSLLGVRVNASASKHLNLHKHLTVGTLKRDYVVHVPPAYEGQQLPLVIVLHGGLGNQASARWDSRMSTKADKDGFFAVYPNGTGRAWTHLLTWNAGKCCGMASKNQVDDIAFLRLLITQMQSEFHVDPDRVYVTGISNGGMMAYRVGRELSDLVAAIAPVAGSMADLSGTAQSPVSVIAFNGTRDKLVPYGGGIGSLLGYKFSSLPAEDTIAFWINNNHCSPDAHREVHGHIISDTYSNGDDGTEVRLYTIVRGPHAWPGGRVAWPVWKQPTHEISATDIMCDFFRNHPKAHHDRS